MYKKEYIPLLFSGFTERTEEGANYGLDVDWYSCADRGSDWWPVYVIQLVRITKRLKRVTYRTLIQILIPRYTF